jgi:hypothetical protein
MRQPLALDSGTMPRPANGHDLSQVSQVLDSASNAESRSSRASPPWSFATIFGPSRTDLSPAIFFAHFAADFGRIAESTKPTSTCTPLAFRPLKTMGRLYRCERQARGSAYGGGRITHSGFASRENAFSDTESATTCRKLDRSTVGGRHKARFLSPPFLRRGLNISPRHGADSNQFARRVSPTHPGRVRDGAGIVAAGPVPLLLSPSSITASRSPKRLGRFQVSLQGKCRQAPVPAFQSVCPVVSRLEVHVTRCPCDQAPRGNK